MCTRIAGSPVERGLLELAFHPEFARNGRLYVHYSAERAGENICVDEDGTVPTAPEDCPFQHTRRVSEFVVSPGDPGRADPASERVVFEKQWPGRKHSGGGLAFGPDGMLYIGLGDGGFVHGPSGAGSPFDVPPALRFGDSLPQDLTSLYGKILRIDVDGGQPYGIPPDNPFADVEAPESCPAVGPLGEPIHDPVIEYLNPSVEDPRSEVAGNGFGRASLGGHVYRGGARPEHTC